MAFYVDFIFTINVIGVPALNSLSQALPFHIAKSTSLVPGQTRSLVVDEAIVIHNSTPILAIVVASHLTRLYLLLTG